MAYLFARVTYPLMGPSSATQTPQAESMEAAVAAATVVGPGAFLTVGRADVIAGEAGRKPAQAAVAASPW